MKETSFLTPCGLNCSDCKYYSGEKQLRCIGCNALKGKPFWGTQFERNEVSNFANMLLEEIATDLELSLYKHPACYRGPDNYLTFDVMERPQNVHISRQFFRWDLDNDKARVFNEPAQNKYQNLIIF